MAIAPITYPISGALRLWLFRAVSAAGALYPYFDQGEEVPDEFEWRRFVVEYTRTTPAGTVEDKAQVGFDIVNLTDGSIDTTWTDADHAAVYAILYDFLTSFSALQAPGLVRVAVKAYRRRFASPMLPGSRFEDSGPPVWINLTTQAGGALGDQLPYQVAMSLTFKTPVPRHWGRVYMPGLTEGSVTSNGRWNAAAITTATDALGVLLNALADAQFPLVVASTQVDSVLGGSLMFVAAGQVDDIPDVIRSRRPKQPAVRSLAPIT